MSDPLADADLDALDQALAAMTPGPWRIDGDPSAAVEVWAPIPPDAQYPSDWRVAEWMDGANAAGIVALRNAAPALLAEVRRLRAAVEHHVAECELLARLGREREDAAEQRAEAAEAREARLRAVVETRLIAADVTAGQMERADCAVCKSFAPLFREWIDAFRAALASAAESGKEDDRG